MAQLPRSMSLFLLLASLPGPVACGVDGSLGGDGTQARSVDGSTAAGDAADLGGATGSSPAADGFSSGSALPAIDASIVFAPEASMVSLTSAANSGTYPRLLPLASGRLLASVTHIDGSQYTLVVSRSTDGGRTFADFGSIASASTSQPDNAHLLELPLAAGDAMPAILAAFRNHDVDANGKPTHFRITVCISVDGGRSWSFLSQAVESAPPLGVWEPFLRLRRDGSVELTYALENASGGQALAQVVSTNRGKAWGAPKIVTTADERARDGMAGIARTRDRQNGAEALVMVFETTNRGPFSIQSMVSYDDGVSWGYRAPLYAPANGRNAGAPQVASFADGSLVALFMTDVDSATSNWPNFAAIEVSYALELRAGVLAWQAPQKLSDATSAWPGIVRIGNTALMACFDHGGGKARVVREVVRAPS